MKLESRVDPVVGLAVACMIPAGHVAVGALCRFDDVLVGVQIAAIECNLSCILPRLTEAKFERVMLLTRILGLWMMARRVVRG